MLTHVADTASGTALAAARKVAQLARDAISTRGRFTFALSGGTTPWAMLDALSELEVDWRHVHLFQVDERKAEDGAAERNWTQVERHLTLVVPIPAAQLHPMPVLDDSERGIESYAQSLRAACGASATLDLAQLGLGDDGHTASLVPDDAVLTIHDRDVAWTTQPYRGSLRMTLTLPCLSRARNLLWLATGQAKAAMIARLCAGDRTIPAGRLPQANALLFLDEAAAADLG